MAWYFFCKYVWTHISNSRIWLSEVSQNHVLISEIIPLTWSDIVTKLSSYIWRKRKGYSLEANQSESCGEAVPFIFKHEAGGGKAQTRRCLRNKCVLRGLSIRKDSRGSWGFANLFTRKSLHIQISVSVIAWQSLCHMWNLSNMKSWRCSF